MLFISERFLYCLQPYYCFFSFFILRKILMSFTSFFRNLSLFFLFSLFSLDDKVLDIFIYVKKIYKKITKKIIKMDLLEDLKMSLLNFSFVMIYIIHKILALLENHLNYLKDNILNALLRSITDF